MPDERSSDEAARLIGQYEQHVARALLDYVSGGHGRRLRGDRDGDRLILTFVLDDADVFHQHLNRLNQELPDGDQLG